MASLLRVKRKSGATVYAVQYTRDDGTRPTITLGDVTKKQAEEAQGYIESLIATRRLDGTIKPRDADWLSRIGADLRKRLSYLGLAPGESPQENGPAVELPTLGAFVADFIARRDDVTSGTRLVYQHTEQCLLDFFSADKPLATITPADGDDFRRWLTRPTEEGGKGLSENTARRRCGIAKQMLRDAVRRRLIDDNPFADMKGLTVDANEDRQFFVTREVADKVLTACPDNEWRLLFALSRYGGLRCPSEHLALRWGDVDFDNGRITVPSPKTARHTGKARRIMPLFPELRPYLEAALEQLLADFDPKERRLSEQPVITRYRLSNPNLRTQLNRIIAKAGLLPWPKLFQNLRASRATELADEFPSHVCAAWLGHSTTIADKHYRQTTDDHFAKALLAGGESRCSAARGVARAANALQSEGEIAEMGGSDDIAAIEKLLDVLNSLDSVGCASEPGGT